MSFAVIDQSKCARDGLCAKECPMSLLTMKGSTSFPEGIEDAEKRCVKCGHCVAVCPHDAISIDGLNSNDCIQINKELLPSVDQTESLIKSRRSIRKYSDKNVEREKIEKLIDIARFAPTGGNSQQVEWLVINSRDEVKKLAGAVVDFIRQLIEDKHPIAEKYSLSGLVKAWDAGIDGIFRGAPGLVIAHATKEYNLATVDCTIALSYLDLAAASSGLGCCWAGFFMIASSQSPTVQKLLNLPEGNTCIGGLMIGYPKYDYHKIPPRKEAKIIWRE